jgi:hypothetical protein
MASYPGAIKTFVNKTDGVDIIHAVDVNAPYDEITAIETELGLLPKGTGASVRARLDTADATLANTNLLRAVAAGGRLTLETGIPVSYADQLAKTTLYYTPFLHDRISMYNGVSEVVDYQFPEKSLSLAAFAANTNYDIFMSWNGGAPILTQTSWISDSARATPLTWFDGLLTLFGFPTYRYLGTIRITGTIGQTQDAESGRFVWNMYNRVPRPMYLTASGSHTYDSATYRQWAATNTYILPFVCGRPTDIRSRISVSIGTTAGTNIRAICCLDDLAAATGSTYRKLGACGHNTANLTIFASDTGSVMVPEGYHYINPEEASSVTATNTFAALYLGASVDG